MVAGHSMLCPYEGNSGSLVVRPAADSLGMTARAARGYSGEAQEAVATENDGLRRRELAAGRATDARGSSEIVR